MDNPKGPRAGGEGCISQVASQAPLDQYTPLQGESRHVHRTHQLASSPCTIARGGVGYVLSPLGPLLLKGTLGLQLIPVPPWKGHGLLSASCREMS